ncbi:MAG: sensor histidine kinase, partial [Balneolaceae bacterium]|nr:sensor histidine kinase [Balneolaceae bacterium]
MELKKYYNSKTRVFWHIAFWVVLVLYHSIIYSIGSGNFVSELVWEGISLPVKMGATYFTLYFLLPQFFMNRKFVRFLLYLVAALLVAAFLQRASEYIIYTNYINPFDTGEVLFYPSKVLKAVIGIYPVVALAAFIKIGKHWYEQDLESRQLQKDKLEAELKFLRSQIHPHFLFNTLNNLYALTLKKSEEAPEVVLRLSDLLNYMLYEGAEWTVPLRKELELIESYISLEKIRYGNRLNVSFRVHGEIEQEVIPPMLLLPFVENSFKHGISQELDRVEVTVDAEIKNSRFHFTVINDKGENQDGPDVAGYR